MAAGISGEDNRVPDPLWEPDFFSGVYTCP
jgi:hypothetical protein